MPYLMSIDPSLTCSGWALFTLEGGEIFAVGKVRALPASSPLSLRYSDLQGKIAQIFRNLELGPEDVVVCEGETTMKDPRAAIRVERVRGIFETLARTYGCVVPGRINPRTVQHEVMGLRGKQLRREIVKETAIKTVRNLYGQSLTDFGFELTDAALRRHQDIVDAILIGHLGLVRVKSARQAGVTLDQFF